MDQEKESVQQEQYELQNRGGIPEEIHVFTYETILLSNLVVKNYTVIA